MCSHVSLSVTIMTNSGHRSLCFPALAPRHAPHVLTLHACLCRKQQDLHQEVFRLLAWAELSIAVAAQVMCLTVLIQATLTHPVRPGLHTMAVQQMRAPVV